MSGIQETKAEKFVRLKDARLGKVLEGLRILNNITNDKDYDYTEDQAREVVDSLYERIDELTINFGLSLRKTSESDVEPDDVAEEVDENPDNGEWRDKGNTDPEGVQSNIKMIDGKRLKVKPGDWDNLQLIRVGPHLGLAMEAVMDDDNETALELLKLVMTA